MLRVWTSLRVLARMGAGREWKDGVVVVVVVVEVLGLGERGREGQPTTLGEKRRQLLFQLARRCAGDLPFRTFLYKLFFQTSPVPVPTSTVTSPAWAMPNTKRDISGVRPAPPPQRPTARPLLREGHKEDPLGIPKGPPGEPICCQAKGPAGKIATISLCRGGRVGGVFLRPDASSRIPLQYRRWLYSRPGDYFFSASALAASFAAFWRATRSCFFFVCVLMNVPAQAPTRLKKGTPVTSGIQLRSRGWVRGEETHRARERGTSARSPCSGSR